MSAKVNQPKDDLTGHEVLVCVCGGIAAYKVCSVVSELAQRGAGVTVAMTRSARRFVGQVTFEALTSRPVLTSLWHSAPGDVQHIRVSEAADLVLVAPATANVLAKMALGLADDLVSTLLLAANSTVAVAPAMNDRMWAHPAVQHNVRLLRERGINFVGPGEGWLACRSEGVGRMVEASEIIDAVVPILLSKPPRPPRPLSKPA